MTVQPRKTNDLLTLVTGDAQKQGYPPELLQYYRLLEKNTILVNDQIDTNTVEWFTIPLLEMEADPEVTHINILLNSPGGDVFNGTYICNIIENLTTPTTITVLGYAESMAGYFLLGGFNNPNVRRRCYPMSTYLLHSGQTNLSGNTDEVNDTMEYLNIQAQQMKQFVLTHSYIDEALYNRMIKRQTFLSSQEMVLYGIVDEIIGQKEITRESLLAQVEESESFMDLLYNLQDRVTTLTDELAETNQQIAQLVDMFEEAEEAAALVGEEVMM